MRTFHSMKSSLCAVFLLISGVSLAPAPSSAQSADGGALSELRTFLFDSSARKSFVNGKADATASNNFLEAFPPWAQNELLEIVMTITSESMLGSAQHVTAYQNGGAESAMGSFSPAVRARIDALFKKLEADKSFNNPSNLIKMQNE